MKKNNSYLLPSLLLLVSASLTTMESPAQTCNSAIINNTPIGLYSPAQQGIVTVIHSKLMWQHCSVGQTGNECELGEAQDFNWLEAQQYLAQLNKGEGFAGYKDWRIPSIRELESLVELACFDPAINLNAFPNTVAEPYWTSSPSRDHIDRLWYVNFFDGYNNGSGQKDKRFRLRLLRN